MRRVNDPDFHCMKNGQPAEEMRKEKLGVKWNDDITLDEDVDFEKKIVDARCFYF